MKVTNATNNLCDYSPTNFLQINAIGIASLRDKAEFGSRPQRLEQPKENVNESILR